jgi:two-component system, NarL family, response regulator NreC
VPPRADFKGLIFPGRKIRCVLAHGHVLLRQGLRRLLEDEPDIDVVSEAGNSAECLRKLYEFRPDVLVADAGTFERPVPEAELLVARESPHTRIVFLSMQEQDISSLDDLQTSTGSCTMRPTSAAEVVDMIRSTRGTPTANQTPTNPLSTNHLELPLRRDSRTTKQAVFPAQRALTAREREVLKLLAEGKTVRAAAMVLGLSSKTVDAHKFNLMRKLGIHNKAELVMWAIQRRVVKIPANF